MKQRRKVAILLVVTLVLQMMPLPVGSLAGVLGIFSVSQAAEPESNTTGDIKWSFDGVSTLTLSPNPEGTGSNTMSNWSTQIHYSGSSSYSGPTAPWGKYANVVTSVTVTGVKNLGNNAFYSFKLLNSVSLSGVTEIGSSAFKGCTSLSSIPLSGVTTIGSSAFENCSSLGSISLSGVTTIESSTFENCTSLQSIYLSGVTAVRSSAFEGCSKLTTVSGSESVTEFGGSAFKACRSLTSISLNAGASMGDYVFASTGLTAVIWPGNNKRISNYAFQSCTGIQNIAIPAQVTSIGTGAFQWCSNATSITNLDVVTSSIGSSVFSACNSLTDIAWSKNVKKISSSAFSNCAGLQNITIPDYVTEIGASAFASCGTGNNSMDGMNGRNVTVTIPDNVETIGSGAFSGCTKMKGVVIGTGVKNIEYNAFYNCTQLTSYTCNAAALAEIGAGAFSETALAEFTVPASVTTIGTNPFVGGNLATIKVEEGNTKYTVENKMLVTKDDAPKVISYPCRAGARPEVPNTVKIIGQSAFMKTQISTVELPEGLQSMETQAFSASTLTIVKLPMSLTSVGQYAFSSTKSLRSVEFQQGLRTIEKGAFQESALTEVSFPGSLQTIESDAFKQAYSLTTVDGKGGRLKTVGDNVFESCTKLKNVLFGDNLETLGDNAFKSCSAISGITLPDHLKNVGTGVFSSCTSLKRIVFPNSMESAGANALEGCTSLESVDFGSMLQEIGGNVFKGCPKLAEVTISENNPNMMTEKNVLYNKAKTKIIYYAAGLPDDKFSVPEKVATVGNMAFTYCSHLEELRFPKDVTKMENDAVWYNTSISKIFFYGNAPEITERSNGSNDKIENGKKITTYYYKNGAITQNKVGSNLSYDNKGLVIFVLKNSTGWENGWSDTRWRSSDTTTTLHRWKDNYNFDDVRWDPDKTDESTGTFESGLKWVYRDDIGEVKFIGEGAVPDFDEGNLFTWVDANADAWLGSIGEPKDYMPDVKLVETGGATRIGKNTFKGAGQLYRVLTESSLTEIGESAFADCPKLAIVDVSNVHKIEKEAFKNDTAIKDDMDARGVREIGEGTFSGCNGMTEILLGEGLQSLGKEAFASCSALETMMLPESTKTLGEGCFTGCSTLRTVNVPAAIQNIPPACFKDCSGLEKVYFYGDCPEPREADAFAGEHDKELIIYCRAANTTWDGINDWNGIPVVHLDKFYREREDHYSFANTGSSFGYSSVYYIPLQRYVTALQSIVRGSFYHAWASEWGGSCFGMASSSTEFYQGDRFNVADYTAGAENLFGVSAPRDDRADLTKLIEIYQVSQFESSISQEIFTNSNAYRKLIKQVEEFERSGGLLTDENADPLVMCLYSDYTGHAVVPVAVNMDDKGNYILDVYDSNYPSSFQKLKIKKNFGGIEYEGYKTASFVKYSKIRDALLDADFTGKHVTKQEKESSTVAIAVNRENVSLTNNGNRDYKEIEGAYEQKPVSDDGEDEFKGIRSFILPQGIYEIKEQKKTDEDNTARTAEGDLKYYVATEDLFSEITTSDENADLTVDSAKGEGFDVVTLSSESEDTVSELTVMDVSGIEKEISVKGKSITIEVNNDSDMTITVSDDATEVKVDGELLELESLESENDRKAEVSFYATDSEDAADSGNVMKVADMSGTLSVNDSNQLSGLAEAYVEWARKDSGTVDVITQVKVGDSVIAEQTDQNMSLRLGMQMVNVTLNNLEMNLGDLSGELSATCEMTLIDKESGERVSVSQPDIPLRAAGTQEPEPEETPEPTAKPTATPTAKPTVQPPSSGYDPVIIIPTPTPTPAATATPPVVTVTPDATTPPVVTVTPDVTDNPIVTPDVTETPVVTPGPAEPENPDVTDKLSVPKKGKVVAAGAMKYIVVKSAKKNGTVAVYGMKNKNAKKAVIPKKVKINGYSFKVTGINKNAFGNMKKLSEVTIGSNVTKIGNGAFKNCKKLQFIIIPKKVTTIGSKAFAGCTSLKAMLVKSDKIKSVGASAFQGITSKMTVKTSKAKWRKYATMFMNRGKMSQNALFIIDPVKLKYKGRLY